MKGPSGSFSAFFRSFTADLDSRGQFWEWKKYRVTLGKVEACLGSEVPFVALDRAAIVAFERHLPSAPRTGGVRARPRAAAVLRGPLAGG